jgi:hypothetical protein
VPADEGGANQVNYPLIILAGLGAGCAPVIVYKALRFVGGALSRLRAVDRMQTNYGKLQDQLWRQEHSLERLSQIVDNLVVQQLSEGKEQ